MYPLCYGERMITLAVSNQKGGVGKTTTALTLGAMLADLGKRVLLVDIDPQASLTQAVGVNAAGRSLAEVLGGSEPGRLPTRSAVREIRPRLHLVPGDLALANCEINLVGRISRESVLRKALTPLDGMYDICLIDCPPSLGLLTVNALAAARAALVPTLPAADCLRGVRLFLDTLDKLQAELNPSLQLAGVIVTQFDSRLTAHQEALAALQHAGLPVLLPTIPRSVRVQESSAARQPLTEYDPESKPAAAYRELTKGLIEWLQSQENNRT